MRQARIFTLGMVLVLVLLLAGCQAPGQNSVATPQAVTNWPTPPPLPTRPALPTFTPTPQRIEPSPTPVQSEFLPGAYVDVQETSLQDTPGGRELARVPAGTRLGALAISADGRWLHVRYQPDPEQPARTGWVAAADVVLFAEIADLPVETPVVVAEQSGGTPTTLAATVSALRLRAGPGVDQPILDTLPAGTPVNLLGRTSDGAWLQVETTTGQQGWMAARWLATEGDIADLPVTGEATTGVPEPAGNALRGSIVFQTSNGGAIYLAAADGSSLQRLSYGFDPALSPDGQQIAFTRWDEPRGLWIMNRDGSEAHLLLAANQARSPTWTPNGSAIIFAHSTGEFTCYETPFGCLSEAELNVFLGGQDCVTTALGTFCRSDFSLVSRSYTGLRRYNLADGSVRDLPASREARAPVHHPQNDEVLYLDGAGYSVTRDAGDVTPWRLLGDVIVGPAVFSPDGRYIYYSRRSGDHWDIWRSNSDGSGPVALTAPPPLRDRPINNVAPTVSPDGRSVLFLSDRGGQWEFWLMNADGSNQRRWAPAALAGISLHYDYANERMADWR